MTDDWKNNIKPTPSTYALHADPNKPLRDAHHTIRQLNDRIAELNEQVSQLTKIHEEDESKIKNLRSMMDNMRQTSRIEERRLKDEIDTANTERGVYRRLIRDILNLKD
jgi:predicted  nucleic acid-binding Zn-ribbon protein